jgi:uncharacterized membrane protein
MNHDGIFDMSRRRTLRVILAAALFLSIPLSAAWAEDGGGDHSGGSGDGGGDHGGGDGGGDHGGGSGDGGGDRGGGGSGGGGGNDHILNAVRSGAVAPLKDILAVVKQTYAGDVVRVKLTTDGQKPIYDIRILGADNQLRDVLVDAKTQKILSQGIY